MKTYVVNVNYNVELVTTDYNQAMITADQFCEKDINFTVHIDTWENNKNIGTEIIEQNAKDRIYVTVLFRDNGESYEDNSTASENVYVGTDLSEARTMAQTKELPESGYVADSSYVETWKNGKRIKVEKVFSTY